MVQINKKRSEIILASKIASKSTGLEWIRDGSSKLGFDKKNMNLAIDESLRRLNTDYIDLYQLHWPERNVPSFGNLDFEFDPNDTNWTSIEETLENLQNLQNWVKFVILEFLMKHRGGFKISPRF